MNELMERLRIEAERRARRSRGARAVTLIEVLIVVAILSLLAAGITVAVLPKFKQTQIEHATTQARELRQAVNRWRATHASEQCPTVSQLVQDKEIDSASKTDDPWNMPYRIICGEDDVTVISDGPDRKQGTADDIQVPKGVPAGK